MILLMSFFFFFTPRVVPLRHSCSFLFSAFFFVSKNAETQKLSSVGPSVVVKGSFIIFYGRQRIVVDVACLS